MIQLAVELPTSMLGMSYMSTDLDFAVAHQVLEDPTYAKHFAERPKGRELILDNSVHELGESIGIQPLLTAADLVRADYLISPDRMDDPLWTAEQFHRLNAWRHGLKIAAVLTGNTPAERSVFLKSVQGADMLCLPYRRQRLAWFVEQAPAFFRVHLLGVSELPELLMWKAFASGLRLSVDTSKPAKHGLLGQRLPLQRSLRHAPMTSASLLNFRDATAQQTTDVAFNISYLRELLHG
jgi:hypothetical protein